MTEDSDNLEILEALAKIEDIGDFRLGDFMRQLGMNPSQPIIFYRRLIKEARENKPFIKFLDDTIDSNNKEIAKLEADASAKDRQIRNLTARVNSLQGEASKKMGSLDKERQELKATASRLQEMAENYEGIKSLLQGKQGTRELGALSRFYSDLYTDALYADLGMRPPPDLAPLNYIRQKLREQLMEVLQIPKDTLETENARLKEHNDALVALINRLYRGGG